MQDPDHNATTLAAFATTLEASPWLRQYAADSAERAAADARAGAAALTAATRVDAPIANIFARAFGV